MDFINSPNIPEGMVRLAVVDGRISGEMERSLKELGIGLIRTLSHPDLHPSVAYHPDMMLHPLSGGKFIHAPGTDKKLLEQLSKAGFELLCGDSTLTSRYPGDIAYNAARVGKLAFHNTRFTDPLLRKALEKENVEWVDVRQGYAKCSISVVDEGSIITSDTGIADAAARKGLDVLLIAPDRKIRLPGMDYGFIGGSTGLLGKGLWAVAGSFEALEASADIRMFLKSKNVEIISLSKGPVMDMGSIFPLLT